jgi:transposase
VVWRGLTPKNPLAWTPISGPRAKQGARAGGGRLTAGEEDEAMPRGRSFPRAFKLEVVRQVESGERRPAQVCREHQLSDGVLWRWRREVAERGEAAFTPPAADSTEALERRIADLERFCGQLALENAILKKGAILAASRTDTR